MSARPVIALAIGAGVGAAVVWATSYAVTKLLLPTVGPLLIGAIRFSIAAVLLGVVVVLTRGFRRMARRDLLSHGIGGLLGITAYFVVENVGVEKTTASDASLIVASYPLMVALLEVLLRTRRVSGRQWSGMALALVGAAVLIADAGAVAASPDRLVGDLLLVLGGVVWAAYTLITREASARTGALRATFAQTVAGAAGFVVLAVAFGDTSPRSAIGPEQWALLGYLALFCSVAGFLMYNFASKHLDSSALVNILNLVPVVGVITAVLLTNETVSWLQIVGGAVIVAGVSLGLASDTRREPSGRRESSDREPSDLRDGAAHAVRTTTAHDDHELRDQERG